MSDDGPTQPPTNTPATPDELAALYLRARDVTCPSCGYNRRDGTSATCPECQAPINFDECMSTLPIELSEVAMTTSAVICITCTAFCCLILYDELRYWMSPESELLLTTAVAIVAFSALGFNSARRSKGALRAIASKRIRTTILFYGVTFVLLAFMLLLAGFAA